MDRIKRETRFVMFYGMLFLCQTDVNKFGAKYTSLKKLIKIIVLKKYKMYKNIRIFDGLSKN